MRKKNKEVFRVLKEIKNKKEKRIKKNKSQEKKCQQN